ncbi:MAG: hypothetical protein HY075_07340, partial [Deltaproteobacteria bacterium]|nr:hypothetical protein [Deltaproteobacteria bacterium]
MTLALLVTAVALAGAPESDRCKLPVPDNGKLLASALVAQKICGTTAFDKVEWMRGAPDCSKQKDPKMQVVKLDENTFVIRQNMCANYEAPFLYLFLGKDKAYLQDTGATGEEDAMPLR